MAKTSWRSKVAGVITAGAVVASLLPTMALGAGELTADTTLTVTGLDSGDKVSFYQILEQASTANGSGWKFVDLLDTDGNGTLDGTSITVDDLRAGANATAYNDFKVITGDMANAIAAQVAAKISDASADGTADGTGKIAIDLRDGLGADDPTPVGLYMAVVTEPAKKDIVYKPIFLSADYDQGAAKGTIPAHDNTNAIELETTVEDTEGTGYKDDPTHGVFKKSKLTLEKVAGDEDDRQMDTKVGDVIKFTVTTNMPSYTQDFVSPVFKITDELTAGLVLCDENGGTAAASDITVEVEGFDNLSATNDYTTTIVSTTEFNVAFKNDDPSKSGTKDGILYKVLGNPQVTITYYAKVADTSVAKQVNQMDNTVTLDFSNTQKDTTGGGHLKDRTRHYTFDIDADIVGDKPGPDGKSRTSELRKIAVDANGKTIYDKVTTDLEKDIKNDDSSVYKWLKGAKFELKQISVYKDADENGYGDDGDFEALATPVEIKFDDKNIAGGDKNPTSDENGYIAMKGLDAGVYELTEIQAPAGYSFDPNIVYVITITPSFTDDAETDSTFTDVPNKILSGYTVGITVKKGATTLATTETVYTSETAGNPAKPVSFINEGDNTKGGITITEENITEAKTALIVNTELGILPSTGGSGIIFYLVVGGAVAGTAYYLLNKDKKETEASIAE